MNIQQRIQKPIILILLLSALNTCQSFFGKQPIVHYRLLGQIEAFQEDGGVEYPEYVADSGTAKVTRNNIRVPISKSNQDAIINYRAEGEIVYFTIGDIETQGQINTWTRIQIVPGSPTFGYDTSCEIWFGTEEPPPE